eukprot:m51a1_g1433 hypothetical protein (613) ;mRNA; f:88850-91557
MGGGVSKPGAGAGASSSSPVGPTPTMPTDRALSMRTRDTTEDLYCSDRDIFDALELGPGAVEKLLKAGAAAAAARKGKCNVNGRNAQGEAPLFVAVRKNDAKSTRLLLKSHAQPNAIDGKMSAPAIVAAIQHRNEEIVKILLEHGATTFYTDPTGRTPLHAAIEAGHPGCFDRIDPYILGVKTVDRCETPLHMAVRLGNVQFTESLLERGAPINAVDKKGQTPLHTACKAGNMELIESLLEHNAPANVTDRAGNTLLHCSAVGGHPFVVERLLESGAILEARNVEGNSVLHLCILSRFTPNFLRFLLSKAPEEASCQNRAGKTPFDLSRETEYFEACDMLLPLTLPIEPEQRRVFAMQFTSDTHLEFGTNPNIVPVAPYLGLLGDIGLLIKEGEVSCLQTYREFLMRQASRFERVFVVMGNHEFYKKDVEDAKKTLAELCSLQPNITMLDRSSFVTPEGVRVVGSTLWSEVPESQRAEVTLTLNDYRRIRTTGGRLLTVDDTNSWHMQDRAFIQSELELAKDENQKVVVLSHHAPVAQCCSSAAEFYDKPANHGFMTDLSHMFGPPMAAWLYGHTHWFQDMTIKGTQIASNPHGYPQDGLYFDSEFVIRFVA